jgi:hypothetical protein
LNAIVEIPKAVNQIPITGQAAKKKCNERELLKAYVFAQKKMSPHFLFFLHRFTDQPLHFPKEKAEQLKQ